MKRGRPTLAEQIRRNEAALNQYLHAAHKSLIVTSTNNPLAGADELPHRGPKRKTADAPPESVVQREVLAALRAHPKVAWCGRINSGTAVAQNSDGSSRYTRFHTIRGMSDLLGQMRDGRMLAIECKRDHHGRLTEDQAAFLDKVRENNGVAGMAWSVDSAIEIIERTEK
jgi:hypothetical protein